MKHRAVFLDRDGTVSEEMGYINHLDRFCVFPWAPHAIGRLREAGFRVVLVTNQAGVARGLFELKLLHEVHRKLKMELQAAGAELDGIYFCPHHPEGMVTEFRQICECRKPKIGMLLQAAQELDIDLPSSFVIGDTGRDLEMGHRAGARSILVLTGYGKGELEYHSAKWKRQPDHVARDLGEASDWILGHL